MTLGAEGLRPGVEAGIHDQVHGRVRKDAAGMQDEQRGFAGLERG